MIDASTSGDQVQIAAGTYSISTTITGKDGVSLYGAYPANATTASATRDLWNNQTILDGQNSTRILTGPSAATSTSKVTNINGLIFQRGNSGSGSAIWMSLGTIIENCIIRNNYSNAAYGAAIYMTNASGDVTNAAGALINCLIINNSSTSSTGGAGGIYIVSGVYFSIASCIIANNNCGDTNGAGGLCENAGSALVHNNIFYGNIGANSNAIYNNMKGASTNRSRSNWFDNASVPIGLVTGYTTNLSRADYTTPGFVSPTTFVGYDATKMVDIAASDWRFISTSGLIDKGYTSDPISNPYTNIDTKTARAYSAITTDLMGDPRRNGLLDLGCYEYTPIAVTTGAGTGGAVTSSITVSKGTSVIVTATPNSGYYFVNWTNTSGGAQASVSASYTFTPTVAISLTANFASFAATKPATPTYSRTAMSISLIWTTVPSATSYNVLDANNNDAVIATNISGLSTTITSLNSNTSYSYKVVAVNSSGQSLKSDPVLCNTRRAGSNYELIDDFEAATNITGWTLSNTGTITVPTSNTITNGINPSTQCAKYAWTSGAKNYAGFNNLIDRIDVGPNAPYRYLHIKYYRVVPGGQQTENGVFLLNLNARTDISQAASTTRFYYTSSMTDGAWHDYAFDLKNATNFPSDLTYFSWIIQPNNFVVSGNVLTVNYQAYIDDVYLSNSTTPLVTTVSGTGGTTSGGDSFFPGVSSGSTTVIATPNSGYRFVNWTNTSGGAQVSTSASYTFTPSGAISLTANFIKTYSVAASSATGGGVSGANTYDTGASVSLVATPASGYRFVDWTNTSDASVASTSATYAFNASTDVSVQANFSATTPVSVSTSPTNASLLGLTIDNDVTVNNGGELIINQSATMNRLIVQAGGKVTVTDGQALNAGIVTLQNTATYVDKNTYTVENPAPAVSAAVSQTLTSGRNWYVSSPITTSTALASQLSTATSVVGYNETTGLWDTQTGALTAGKGYISVTTKTNGDIAFNGSLNTGDVSVILTRSGTNASKPGFNLVGNPYPSYINWTEATANAANVLTTIWYRTKDAGQYTFYTYNPVSDIAAPSTPGLSSYIPPMQAFWLRVKDSNGGTLKFTNSMRAHDLSGGTNLLKVPAANKYQQQVLRLQVSNELNSDEAIVLFNPNASDGFDAYDSPKMSNANPAIPEIYTLAGNEHLVINGLSNVMTNSELPLGFTPGASNTNFSIKATQVSNFDSNMQILLKDNVQNSEFDITAGKPYYFSSDATNTTARFTLVFKTNSVTTGINDKNTTDNTFLNIYRNENNKIAVNQIGVMKEEGVITVYNSIGQQLVSTRITGTCTVIKEPLNMGIYLVLVNIVGGRYTKKLILN